ncbi:hypothetical protein [Halomonas salifodinae]|uniref:hypothetical protein n=1 Tax=Halomonas salifodinae TaxID=438745 RepID=UPI0033AFA04C
MEYKEERFSISYDAEDNGLSDHKISAKDLGNAILGMNELVSEVYKTMYNDSSEAVELKVTAPAKEGSFIVEFLMASATPEVVSALRYIGIATATTAIAGGSLFEIVKAIKNKKIINVRFDKAKKFAHIDLGDETIVTDMTLGQLATDKKVRAALDKVAHEPLKGKKGASFKVIDEKEVTQFSATNDEVLSLSQMPEGSLEEHITDIEFTTVTFTQINFDSSKGWKMKHQGEERKVEMLDKNFLTKVAERKQEFVKDDLFEVRLQSESIRRITSRTSKKYKILEVTGHFASKERRLV